MLLHVPFRGRVHAKRNIAVSAILTVMFALAGCGGSGSSNPDPVGQPATDNKAAQEMAMKLHEVLGLLGVRGDVDTTLSLDSDEFNLDDDIGRAVLTRTADSVPGVKPGWNGGHFRNGNKEARVYWRAEASENAYSYYGWWIDTDNDNGGYSLAFFLDSTAVGIGYASQDVSATAGTVTYEGGAAGQYAIYSTIPKAHESGDFTADITFEANFDTDRVSGAINRFMVDGSKKDWTVALQENVNNPEENRFFFGKAVWEIDGTQPGGADKAASDWVLGFRDMDVDGIPNIAGGLFDVRNGNASMYGSFGATK